MHECRLQPYFQNSFVSQGILILTSLFSSFFPKRLLIKGHNTNEKRKKENSEPPENFHVVVSFCGSRPSHRQEPHLLFAQQNGRKQALDRPGGVAKCSLPLTAPIGHTFIRGTHFWPAIGSRAHRLSPDWFRDATLPIG